MEGLDNRFKSAGSLIQKLERKLRQVSSAFSHIIPFRVIFLLGHCDPLLLIRLLSFFLIFCQANNKLLMDVDFHNLKSIAMSPQFKAVRQEVYRGLCTGLWELSNKGSEDVSSRIGAALINVSGVPQIAVLLKCHQQPVVIFIIVPSPKHGLAI